eukprot:Opistho-1_new@99194
MAPEALRSEPVTEKCDVFSFGITMCEVASRQRPYHGFKGHAHALLVLISTDPKCRPEIPADTPPAFSELTRMCIEHSPDDRPSFAELLPKLEALSKGTKWAESR